MTANGPVIIKRQPAGDWACDACRTQGAGWLQIEAHNKRTGHKVYTELRPPR
jgi:ribosomal protein L37AE/L43A